MPAPIFVYTIVTEISEDTIMYILIPACLCIAALFVYQECQGRFGLSVILKGIASLCFVLLGFLASRHGLGSKAILTGLFLGAIADVLLNLRFVYPETGKKTFMAGILVFLCGHIAYLAAILPMNPQPWTALFSGCLLTLVLMKWILPKITAERTLKIFGVVYIGAIAILTSAAVVNLTASFSAFHLLFTAGAVLFLVSDIVLILNTFGPQYRFSMRITNLSLYYFGQILIALSLSHLQ